MTLLQFSEEPSLATFFHFLIREHPRHLSPCRLPPLALPKLCVEGAREVDAAIASSTFFAAIASSTFSAAIASSTFSAASSSFRHAISGVSFLPLLLPLLSLQKEWGLIKVPLRLEKCLLRRLERTKLP
jgi:hypothetical protein